eukprot:365672-Chlamydomonas_euryale.AAC.15
MRMTALLTRPLTNTYNRENVRTTTDDPLGPDRVGGGQTGGTGDNLHVRVDRWQALLPYQKQARLIKTQSK